jgi:CAAX protease family protein
MRQMLKFFAITFVLSWAAWLAAAAVAPVHTGARGALFLFGTFAPAIIAVTLASASEDEACDGTRHERGAVALLRRIGRWRVGARWYVFALAYMAAIKLLVALIMRLGTGAWPRFGETHAVVMIAAIALSTWAQAGEEIGWRGFALPRLTRRFGLVGASLILGIIWAAWHLPLFFIRAGDTYGQSFPLFLSEVTAMSVALAWLYWRTGGSLLLTMILHSAINNTKDIVPSVVTGATNPFALSPLVTAWLTVGLLWLSAAFLAWRMRGVREVGRTREMLSSKAVRRSGA